MIRRDKEGRPLIVPPGQDVEVPYLRPSSINVGSTRQLDRWRMTQAAAAALEAPGELRARIAHREFDAVEEAMDRYGSNAKRDKGSDVHREIEVALAGDVATAPARAALDALKAHDIEPLHVEQFMVDDCLMTAGTCDLIVKHLGQTRVLDWKTGTVHPASVAAQLACYAYATRWTEELASMPLDIDRGYGLVAKLTQERGGEWTVAIDMVDLHMGRRLVDHHTALMGAAARGPSLLTRLQPAAVTVALMTKALDGELIVGGRPAAEAHVTALSTTERLVERAKRLLEHDQGMAIRQALILVGADRVSTADAGQRLALHALFERAEAEASIDFSSLDVNQPTAGEQPS